MVRKYQVELDAVLTNDIVEEETTGTESEANGEEVETTETLDALKDNSNETIETVEVE